MSSIKVVSPGLLTMVQDEGRFGYQRFGVPVAGVFDRFAARIANWLVGNEANAAVLEATFLGPSLQAECTLQAAITGGDTNATLDGQPVPHWETFTWQTGQTLNLGAVTAGARFYLAVNGGIQVPPVMGSRSTYVRAEIGGHEGRKLQKDDSLPVDAGSISFIKPCRLPMAFRPQLTGEHCLRVVLGPQDDYFTKEAIQGFLAGEYKVAPASDRMGIRLQGPAVNPLNPDIVSDAITYGSVQVPKDGQPIIMGPDRQTTGGYPKIATVLEHDMSRLSQAKPGDVVRFVSTSVEDAQEIDSSIANHYKVIRGVLLGEITGREYAIRIGDRTFYSFCEQRN